MKKQHELEREIAELKMELQVERERNQQMERLLSLRDVKNDQTDADVGLTRSKLWSSISHEILTPMDAILGMTDLVMDTELTSEQSNYLEMINASADRLFGVISDVIDYSELLEGKLRCDVVNFDLFEELEYDLYIAKLSCKHKELNFTTTFSRDIPNYLNSDPARLRQVLGNIIGNAIKYTDEGEISVRVEKDGYDGKGRLLLKFTVRDTGGGILPGTKQRIFETPMTLGITGGEEKFSEGGLSLVVSAKLVELFGGKIGVESSDAGGSVFWFTWPVANPVEMYMGELPADMFSQVQDRSMVLQGAKVLLAEDEHINASITKAFLEQAGLKVTVVGNGREALEALEKDTFRSVLMDVQMPVMDGLEATSEIRRRERQKGCYTPIIALTAHAMHGDRERCLQAGMDDYLPKPLDKNQLIEMLARCMTKKALVVGSDPVNQHQIIGPLVHGGWAVIIAETGRLAMYEASLSHFDMIVIDSSLPVDDGLETVKAIRKLEEFSGCRATIIGVGFAGENDGSRYSDCGVDALYTRSVMDKEFKERVAILN
jgi:signal transduction histidine kinase/CheY-like chemotaxis protein